MLTPFISIAAPLECKAGPLSKSFGGNDWLVYACNDDKSVVVVSASGNPAMPFYFSISLIDGRYVVHGEGKGDKSASSAANRELIKLTKEQIEKLIIAAKKA